MPATRADIQGWLTEARSREATHLIVKCDSFDFRGPESRCCYPVYVSPDEDVREIETKNDDRTMEVYSMRLTDEEQLAEARAFHYD